MKILIAEDDTVSRLFLQKALKNLGYPVVSCADGEEARQAYLQEHYSMVISDWIMPRMDGLELCRAIRQQNLPDYCYFIMLTGRASKTDIRIAMDGGDDDYLIKPLDPNEIEARLRVAERILML